MSAKKLYRYPSFTPGQPRQPGQAGIEVRFMEPGSLETAEGEIGKFNPPPIPRDECSGEHCPHGNGD